jgi:SnoaL-like domain
MSTDLLEIQRLLYDYAWGCDEGMSLRALFSDDAELDYSSTGGPAGGPDEVVAWLESSLSGIRIQHMVSNFRIDVTGDAAAGTAMFLTTVHLVGLAQPLTTGGYYGLSFVRVDGRWKIRRLYEDNRWMHPAPPRDGSSAGPSAADGSRSAAP